MSSKSINRKIMPDFGKKENLEISNPRVILLKNGLRVFLIDDNSINFTRVEFVFCSGTSFQEKNVVAETALNLLNEGSKNFSGEEIATKLDFFGAYFEPLLTKDKSSLAVYTLTKHLDSVLEIIYDLILYPVYDQSNISNYLNRKKQKYISDLERVKYQAMVEFNRLVFGANTPYGSTKVPDDFDQVTRDDVIQQHSQKYFTTNNYLILAGNTNDTILSKIDELFGSIKLHTCSNQVTTNYNKSYTPGFYKIKKNNSIQSAIRIGRLIMPKSHEDYNGFVLLNTILGGYFGSRLMTNLRERNGYTYGINSFILNFRDADYWSIATQVNINQTDAAIKEIHHEIERLKTEPVSNEELKLVKNYIYGTYLRSFDGPMAMADRTRAAIDLDLEVSHYKDNLNSMLNINTTDLLKLANKYFNSESFVSLIIGDSNFSTNQ